MPDRDAMIDSIAREVWKNNRRDAMPSDPSLICALRAGRPEHSPESEPVLIETVGEAGLPQVRGVR